jgi:hypothetical protein
MTIASRFLTLTVVLFAAAFAFQALAQVDTQKSPPGPPNTISAHRMAALKKCTDGQKFASDKYVACMTAEGEAP